MAPCRTWVDGATRAATLLAAAGLVASCGGTTPPPGSADPATVGPSAPASGSAGLASPGATVAAGPSAGPVSPGAVDDTAWILDPTAMAVDLDLTLDADKTVEAVVPIEGGSVSATGADGTVYTLDIPANALLTATLIGLTPVTSVGGLPFGGQQTHAVQLSPDGLFLYAPAVLTIAPVRPIPPGEQLPFGYEADGKDVILAQPVIESTAIQISVPHFSGNGVTRGLLADIEPDRRRIGGDAERRLTDALNAEVIRIRQEGGEFQGAFLSAAYEAAMLEFEQQVVVPRVAAAGESCAKGRLAIESVMSLDRQRQLLGLPSTASGLERYPGLVEKAARVCVIEEFELCVEDHVIHRMAMVWRSMERQFELLSLIGLELDAGPLREARELTVQCLTFKLKLESTGTVDAADGGYESTVTSEVTLRFDPDADTISGDAPLVNTAFTFKSPCGATSVKGGGDLVVNKLRILTARPDQFESRDLDLLLSYMPGPTSESAKIKICGSSGGRLPIPPFPAWTSTFLATHIAELDTDGASGGGYIALDWEVFGDEYYARKEWIRETRNIVEAGTFKLYHTPGA
jgi:hypothetical protein